MLDARRAKQKGYITLKEAAELSQYSPDYLGQLIRAGKLKGEQVYSQVAWVTTKEEVAAYLERTKRSASEREADEMVRSATRPVVVAGAIISVLLLIPVMYILSASIEASIERSYTAQAEENHHAYNERP